MTNETVFTDFFEDVLHNGGAVDSRHGMTIEAYGPRTVSFHAGMLVRRPRAYYPLGWMELLQFIGGVFDPEAIKRVAPNANHELFTAQMAYGPRVLYQIPDVIEKLRQDPLTRQAIVFIGSQADGTTDRQPCTTSMQFLLRHGVLRTVVSMRSWDLVKGMTYDVMMFGGMAMAVAHCLGVAEDMVHVTAGSPHIYVAEQELAPLPVEQRFDFDSGLPTEWVDLVSWARAWVSSLGRRQVPDGIIVRSTS